MQFPCPCHLNGVIWIMALEPTIWRYSPKSANLRLSYKTESELSGHDTVKFPLLKLFLPLPVCKYSLGDGGNYFYRWNFTFPYTCVVYYDIITITRQSTSINMVAGDRLILIQPSNACVVPAVRRHPRAEDTHVL